MQSLINIALVVLLSSLPLQSLEAKPSKSAELQTQPTMFSTPDAETDVVPTFVTPKGQPLPLQSQTRLPSFRHAKLLKSLTVEQKKAIANLESDTNIRIQALQERLAHLNQRLDVAKAHPDDMVFVQFTYLASPTKLKQEIAGLSQDIDSRRHQAEVTLSSLLTEEQRQQIERMKDGQPVPDTMPAVEAEHLPTASANSEPLTGTAAGADNNPAPTAPGDAK